MASDTHPRPVPEGLDTGTIDQLLGLDDGGTGLLQELFGLFQEDSPGRISEMTQRLAEENLLAVSELAHALKGAAGTIGAIRMRAVALEIERGGKSGMPLEALRNLAGEVQSAYAEACAALQAYLDGN